MADRGPDHKRALDGVIGGRIPDPDLKLIPMLRIAKAPGFLHRDALSFGDRRRGNARRRRCNQARAEQTQTEEECARHGQTC